MRDIHVTGHVLTHEDVIRKALTIEPGSALSRSDLLASQTRLYGRGIFSSVSIEAEPPAADGAASGPASASPGGVVEHDVRVSVREMAPITQVFGVGYSSDEKLRGQYEISNRNIFGSGRYVGLQTRASNLMQRGTLSYREKGLLGGSYDLLASAFGENEVHPGFDVRTIGSSIVRSRSSSPAQRRRCATSST